MSRDIKDNAFLFLAYASKREQVKEVIINNSLDDAVDIIVQMIADASYES